MFGDSEIYRYEAINYGQYENDKKNGLKPSDKTNKDGVNVKLNGDIYTVGPYTIQYNDMYNHFSRSYNSKKIQANFAGISSMEVIGYNSNNEKVEKTIAIDKIIINNLEKIPDYFKPNDNELIDRTNQFYPRSNQSFSIKFKDPNKGVTSKEKIIVSFKIRVKFGYMLVNGKYKILKGEKNYLYYTHTDSNGKCIRKGQFRTIDQQNLITADAIRSVYEQELDLVSKKITIDNGSYKVNLKKVSSANANTNLENAGFKVLKYNFTSEKYENYKTNVKTDANGEIKSIISKTITFNSLEKDYYKILETVAPEGHMLYTNCIYVEVTKKLENGTYVVNEVNVYDGSTKLKCNDNSKPVKPVKYETSKSNGNTTITLTVKDPKIKDGNFNLKLNKVSSINSSDPLSGAVFKIEKKENGNWKQIKFTTTNSNGECTLLNNEKITNLNDDEYKITETTAPYGFVKFDGSIEVKVPKKVDMTEGKYVIDNDKITLTVKDKNGNKITRNSPVSMDTKDGTITLKMKNEPQYDLALRKFITSINGIAPKESREPSVNSTTLKNGTFDRNGNKKYEYTATYKHNKDEEGKVLEAATGDRVVYTIRIYNEGKKDGTATKITDYLPAGLKLVNYSNSTINKKYGWKKGESDKEGYTAYTTTYLKDKNKIISAFNEKNDTLSFKDVQIECEVIATKAKDNLKNIAEITDDDGKDRDSTPKNVNRGNYGSTSQQDDDDFEVLKFRPTINLGGTVWEDLREGKETLADGLKDSGESGIGDIKVELYQKEKDGEKASPYTDGTKIAETTTKGNGTYMFEKQPMDKLYYIKFTYNGQNYENTIYNAQKGKNDTRKKSTATEKKQDRDNFNNGFNINDISDAEIVDKSKYFEDYNKLTYKNRKNQNISCEISAYTGQQSGKSFAYSLYGSGGVDNVTINTIDFGITKRIEFDMKLEKDVYAATVTVNGKTQIYEYNKKDIKDSIKDSRPNFESLSETEKEKALSNWTITVVEGDYQRAIAEPDYNFTGVNGNGKTLELYVTYKVAVKNQSMSMLGEVTKIKDYYDPTYTYVSKLSWISSKNYSTKDLTDVRGRIINSLQNSKEISNEETNESTVRAYDNVTNNTLDIAFSGKLQSGEAKYLYLTFKVKNDKDGKDGKVIKGVKTNKAEIAAFKSYYKKGTVLPCYNGENEYEVKNNTTIAGRVDRDSIPNNLNNKPKEDDEDEAPGLNVKVEGDRTITGFVWEDARNNNVEGSMIGNGMYKQGSQDIGDKDININDKNGNTIIKIELLEVNGVNEKSKYEGLAQENLDYKDKVVRIIDKPQQINGNTFTFNNVVAGDYIVKFTYGDGSVKYNGQDYKTTIFKDYGDNIEYNSTQNSNLSGAADVWSEREKLNNSSKTMKNTKAKSLADKENCSMTAETKKIVAEIEMNSKGITEDATYSMPNYTISGVNLGLVERPKAQLELNKTVSNVKVTLADGSILFDASQGVNVDNVAWQQNTNKNRGLIQLSMDQEIMHGASIQITYKLTVKNVGEVDYEGKEFYYTGKNHGNTVTTTPNTVVDYVSNNLQFNGKNNTGWEVVNADTLYKDGYIDQAVKATARAEDKVKTKAQKINTIVKTDALNTALEPGKSVDTTLVLTQVITPENKNDNLTYSNIAEIVEVSNTVGRKMAFSIVGNQDPTANTPSEIDASIAEKIVILPPFGDGNIVYYILGAVVGIILIGGITLIIKKVLIIK